MLFGFFRRQQEQLIDERMELLREDIEDMLNACVGQITGRADERIRKGAGELRSEFDRRFGEISLGLEQVMESVPKGMADRGAIEELRRELKQSRMENQQLAKQVSELLLAMESLTGSVKEIQAWMEKLDANSAQMPSAPLPPYPYQMPFQPPLTQGSSDRSKLQVSWPASGSWQQPEPAPVSASAPWVSNHPEVGGWNPDKLDGGNRQKPSKGALETAAGVEDFVHVPAPEPVLIPVFTEDPSKNKRALTKCMMQCTKLQQTLEQVCGTDGSLDIYRKLLDKCYKKLDSLSKKLDEKKYDTEKLAREVIKVFEQSVVKGLSQESVAGLMGDFLVKCGLRKIGFKPGQKLTDSDYEYVDDLVFYEEVREKTMNNCIIEVRQDAYVLDYIDEDGPGEAVIQGSYRIGTYKG